MTVKTTSFTNKRPLPAWWPLRGAHTRSHSELGRENPQRRWYSGLSRGRVGRCQACRGRCKIFSSLSPLLPSRRSSPICSTLRARWSGPLSCQRDVDLVRVHPTAQLVSPDPRGDPLIDRGAWRPKARHSRSTFADSCSWSVDPPRLRGDPVRSEDLSVHRPARPGHLVCSPEMPSVAR